ncbi:hypothetical protein K450DRAFT_217080 [Umbelopsis ramanniana AG]|uniref:ELYS-like domain-containing protein n=1 Tax=Umbelopsis ramanniana AG TaxID=1314678 RepID=A0AAD5EJI4_UMBRA|nr:uncharacterized protein K450DRAFT_217080 [Umbelopsis ramanniana AG]KAI8584602.1 hypothetical protein K450DRAFT_217080 [Umbelopsis ramanniana AG]
MVQLLSRSSVLPPLPQKGRSDKILGGSLIPSNEIQTTCKEWSPLSLIYRYNSTTLEVRDILLLQPVYALLTIHDLPTPDRHRLVIELATHGTMGSTLCIVLLARDTHTQLPKLFIFNPRTLRCHIIYSSFNSKNSVTSMSMSLKIQLQDDHPSLQNSETKSFHLLALGTDSGAVFLIRLCLGTFQTISKIPCIMAQCKTSSVGSIAVHVTSPVSSDASVFILIGGNNGEIEVITYEPQANSDEQDCGTHGTKVITTLWKNMAVVSLMLKSAEEKSEVILVAGQGFRNGSEITRSEIHNPAVTMLKLKLPTFKSMEVWKEECSDTTNGSENMQDCESSYVGSFCIYETSDKAVDKKLKLSSISSLRRKHEMEVISFKQWNISRNYDGVTSCRQQTVTNVPVFLNGAVADAFGKVVILAATELHTLYTTVAQPSKSGYEGISEGDYDFSGLASKLRRELSKRYEKASRSYTERRIQMGSPLIIDLLLEQNGYHEQYPVSEHVYERYCDTIDGYSSTSGPLPCCSHILLYIILDACGKNEFEAFAKNIHLNTTTSQMIMDYWAIDNFQIDKLNAMNSSAYIILFPTLYIKVVKMQVSLSAALKLIETNHIPIQDITDEEVLTAYLLKLKPKDVILELNTICKTLDQTNRRSEVLCKLLYDWFEVGNTKVKQVQLFSTPLNGQLEREVVTYCSSTNPSPSNLNFLFAFYLNRYDYASAMDIHERLQKEDMSSLGQQQRKVMIDSITELIPSIQRRICKVRSDNHGSVQSTPFSAIVFSQTSETEQSMILEQLVRQTQLLNSNDPHSNPFSGPPKMVR